MRQPVQRSTASVPRRCLRLLLLCGGIYLLACLGCARFQRRLIYFPPVLKADQVDELARAEKVERWRGPSGEAIGWKSLAQPEPARGQVLILHGNACCAFQCARFLN